MEAKALAEEQKRLNPDCWKRKRTNSVRTSPFVCEQINITFLLFEFIFKLLHLDDRYYTRKYYLEPPNVSQYNLSRKRSLTAIDK